MPPSEADLAAGLALVPQQVRDALPRTEVCDDSVPRVKLHAPWSYGPYAGWSWYVISIDGADDNLANCYVEGLTNEYGDVRLDQIAAIRGPRGQRVVRVEGQDRYCGTVASCEESMDRKRPNGLQDAEDLRWHGADLMDTNQEMCDALSKANVEIDSETEAGIQEFRNLSSTTTLKNDRTTPRSLEKESRERLVRTFKFLRALAERRTPERRDLDRYPQVLRLDAWPAHPCIAVRRGNTSDDEEGDTTNKGLKPIIRIARAKLTPCPEPPHLLKEWLKPGWEAVDEEVEVLQSRNFRAIRNRETVTVEFTDDHERVSAFNSWKAARMKWIEAERPALSARKIFENIYALWTTMEREGDRLETVIADGMLCVEDHLVRHPVLVQRISLDFDPSVPEFRFFTGLETVELQRTLLRLLPMIEGKMIAHFDQRLEEDPVEPLGGSDTEGFFRSLVQGLFKDGDFLDSDSPTPTGRPCLWREPVLIVRPRISGFSTMIDKIIERLKDESSEIPDGLSRIVGVELEPLDSDALNSKGGNTAISTLDEEPDVLFSKPSNSEQREIVNRLQMTKSVVVQGPPGTGKTHTIANLIGHLLSEGQTVLVTAHTTKALRVLRSQIEEPIRPLCLSVLGGDSNNQSQLSHAAKEIVYRLSRSDPDRLRREADELRAERQRRLRDAENLQRQLRDARYSEIDEIVIGGEALRPIDVAKRVREGSESDSWIPGPLELGVQCPLTAREVRRLYDSQRILTREEEAQLAEVQPDIAKLVIPSDFRQLAHQHTNAELHAQSHRPEFWDSKASEGCTADRLRQLQERVQRVAENLAGGQSWLRTVLYEGWIGGELRNTWEDLLAAMEKLSRQAATAKRLAVEHGPELPNDQPVEVILPILSEIVQYYEGNRKLGFNTWFTKHHWHRLADSCKVNGRLPQTLDEFRALREAAQCDQERDHFVARWRRLVEKSGGPSIDTVGGVPEQVARMYVAQIRKQLDWRRTVLDPLIKEFGEVGFLWIDWLEKYPPEPSDHREIARIQSALSGDLDSVIEGHRALLQQTELAGELEGQKSYLGGFPQSKASATLQRAQEIWNVDNYDSSYRALSRLRGLQDVYERRLAMIAKLEEAAPRWAQAIVSRVEPHHGAEPPGDHTKAWFWRQCLQELERRSTISIDELQERYEKTYLDSLRLSARIIDRETWAAQCERTGLKQRQALTGFVQTIRKVGKGTGKRAPRLLRQARQLLSSARHAVPVWIMPLSRVYESFDPEDTKFDVVIVDEASQSDVTALAALYLGRSHIVVGDKEQVTPDAVGQRIEDIELLIESELQGIPNYKLYDGQTSIYDLAEAAFGGVVALREHFRCVPEIIQFSNHLSYNNTILPLREPSSAPVRPPVIPHRVNGYRDRQGKFNEVEAEEIASLVAACVEDPAYIVNELGEPTSFGIISLLGNEQAYRIERKLRKHLPPHVFAKHRILCGNAAQFQGDERDVVFLSVVDGPPDEGKLSRRVEGPNELYKKRYNVAVSRARNQAWVVHSLDPDSHLKNGDIRRRLIEHARDPDSLMRAIEQEGGRTESEFERLVLERLVSAGYRVRPQWPVGAYRIDLVVVGENDRRLAVECDGERWHTAERLEMDWERQSVLERLGWVFSRVRGSLFFRAPDKAMEAVFAKLQRLGIEPLGTVTEQDDLSADIVGLKRRAERIRREWAKDLVQVDIEGLRSFLDLPI